MNKLDSMSKLTGNLIFQNEEDALKRLKEYDYDVSDIKYAEIKEGD